MRLTLKTTIQHPSGLHARPASLFVQTANKYQSDITVQNLTEASPVVNAKSILNILTLGVMQNHEIEIVADGDDAEQALEGFTALIKDNFGE